MSFAPFAGFACAVASAHAGDAENLALRARASASETYEQFTPEKACDGDGATRWSGIPGHNEGVWFELGWERPVAIACVVVRQFDRFVMELDVEAFDDAAGEWRVLQHFGAPGRRLHGVVLWRSQPGHAPVTTTKLRVANITNGPSFNELEVWSDPWAVPPELHVAPDASGGLFGVVTDRFGAAPVAGADVSFEGTTPRGAWRAGAKSDEHGLVELPLPLGLRGDVRTRIVTPDRARFDGPMLASVDFCNAITPFDPSVEALSLDGLWRFAEDPSPDDVTPAWAAAGFDDSSWLERPVPSHLVMHGLEPRSGIAACRRRFTRPVWSTGWRAKLQFDAAYSSADVFVNGRLCARHEGGATPFEADVTDLLRNGENVVAVRLREHTDASDRLDRMSQYADFPLLGLWRSVGIAGVPPVHVGSLVVSPRFDERYVDATVAVRVEVANESNDDFAGEVAVMLTDPDGAQVSLDGSTRPVRAAAWQRAVVDLAPLVRAPQRWDAEHPRLHSLAVVLLHDGQGFTGVGRRVGFRQTDVRGSELLVNGAPVKLRGTCHHDGHPLLGRAIPPSVEREDVRLILAANLNALRTSHYPPHEELLDAADELGCYVEDEAPFCWVGDSNDLRLAPRILQLTAELVARDRNHPSVFMWSLCNESEFGWGFERSHEWIRRADPSRPTGAAISASLEVETLHNPITLERIAENEELGKPLLFDESFCVFQGIFGDVAEMWVDPGVRDAWVTPLVPIAEKFFASRATQGSMIWCFADDLFCVPGRGLEYGRGATRSHFVEPSYRMEGRGIVGDAPWGFVDGWRREKPEYFHVRRLFAPLCVTPREPPLPAQGEPLRVRIENRFDHTDLSEVQISWRVGDMEGTVRASAPPRSSAEVSIATPRPPRVGESLLLSFLVARGPWSWEDGCELWIGAPSPSPGLETSGRLRVTTPLVIDEESTLSGSSVRIRGDVFELAFDRSTGTLRRCVVAGAPVLVEGPRIHVLPTGAALAPVPAADRFRLDGLEVVADGSDVRIVQRGAWDSFTGTVEWRVARDGSARVTSSVVYDGPELNAREVGLALTLPVDFTRLKWDRNAEWSVYPADHVGRPVGFAWAFPQRRPADRGEPLPPQFPSAAGAPIPWAPTWPWALDPSPMGCNDFRSTKRSIRRAALIGDSGAEAEVLSDGSQHVRASVESDRVRLHVLDYSGGTAAGWWEWIHNYGTGRKLRSGDRLESAVTIRLVP